MLDVYSVYQILGIAMLGLTAGVLGGMLGVGGSVLIIPALAILLGRPTGVEQHLYQAAAMIANVAVSIPAALRHRRAGAMNRTVLTWMLPSALLCIVVGVWASNLPIFAGPEGGLWLGRLLAVFLIYVIIVNALRLRPAKPQPPAGPGPAETRSTDPPSNPALGAEYEDGPPRVTGPRSATIGSVMGTLAGLLGIGGGGIAVPLQQTLLRLPLRQCIANSSAVICVTAAVGAIYKNATLAGRVGPDTAARIQELNLAPIDWTTGLTLGLLLAPTAWAGGRLGAALTHRLPLRAIRVAFIALMLVAAWKMAALPT